MEFKLLGPVQARAGDQVVNLGVRKQRFTLAVLALEVNTLVPVERLVDLLWPGNPPRTARGIVHAHISRLRTTLSNAAGDQTGLRSEPSGFTLLCDPLRIDAHRFIELLAEARDSGADEHRVALLDEALGLWRGTALAGCAPLELQTRLCGHLDEARIAATEDRTDALLRLGRDRDVLPELTRLASKYPHRHRITGQLMLALYRAGRTAEALATYRHAQRQLADDFGIDPPAELRQLELAILRDDPALTSPAGRTATLLGGVQAPRQLPADVAAFTGRVTELAQLLDARPDGSGRPTVVISAIDGMAGVGKTALAIHAAHHLKSSYPDGQVFINLHGFTQGASPVDPANALDRMLRAVGVSGHQVPQDVDERAAAWRTHMAGKRMLLVLDNAASESQVRPLLPGSETCLVLITSRRRLARLDDILPISLDVLPPPDAVALFIKATLGRAGVARPEVIDEIVELCGRLPLAIRLASARLRHRLAWTVGDLAELLRDERHRLAGLEVGQLNLAAALHLSYTDLRPDQRRLFRLLGLHPGPDIAPPAAAALADHTVTHTRDLLEQLLDANLLQQYVPGRFQFHDLLRTHAAATAADVDPQSDRRAALARLHDHYLHTAAAATASLYPYYPDYRTRIAASAPVPVPNAVSARAWLDAEQRNLLATADHAGSNGWPLHTVQVSAILRRHLLVRARYGDAEFLHTRALRAARSSHDLAGELAAVVALGHVEALTGRDADAGRHMRRALTLASRLADPVTEAEAESGLGNVLMRAGKPAEAIRHFERALAIAGRTGDHVGQLEGLRGLGSVYVRTCSNDLAVECFLRSKALAQRTGNLVGEQAALRGLGDIHGVEGRHAEATACFQRVQAIARETGNRSAEIGALRGLGNVNIRAGRPTAAMEYYEHALAIARETGERNTASLALVGLGDAKRLAGQHGPAADHYHEGLGIARVIDNRNGQVEALNGLGRTLSAIGRYPEALAYLQQALDFANDLNQPHDQALALDGIAGVHRRLDQVDQARQHWQRALEIFASIGTPEADQVRNHIAELDGRQAPRR